MPGLILLAALMISGAASARDGAPANKSHQMSIPDRPAVWPIDPGANSTPGTGDYIVPDPGRLSWPHRDRLNIPTSMGQGSVTPPMYVPGD
jgi:hypothetical protein